MLNNSTSSQTIHNASPSNTNSGSMSPNSPISPASLSQQILNTHNNPNLLSVLGTSGQLNNQQQQQQQKNQMRKSVTVQNQQNFSSLASKNSTTSVNTSVSTTGSSSDTSGYNSTLELNVLLDPDIINDYPTQALVLTVLATLVRNSTDENEIRVLYQYIAEASIVFSKGLFKNTNIIKNYNIFCCLFFNFLLFKIKIKTVSFYFLNV